MAYRYTNTDKWDDAWFVKLKPMEKLLFNFLCDKCDIAGFIELNSKTWAVSIGTNLKSIEGALKGLQRGLIYSESNDCIYLRTFLKHQKNLPLNPEKNMAHRGIIKRFELYSFKFSIEDIYEFIKGACKGPQSPYGNGIGNGNGITEEKREELLRKREDAFKLDVSIFSGKYPEEMIQKFYNYWTEKNKSKTKMRFELEKVFEISKRLATWASRDKDIINSGKKVLITLTYDEILAASKDDPAIWNKYDAVKRDGEKKAIFVPKK